MKTYQTTIDEDGMITLPQEFCEQNDWREGDTVVFTLEDEGIVVKNSTVREREKDLHIVKIERTVTSYYAVKTNAATGRFNAADAANVLDDLSPIHIEYGEPSIINCEPAVSKDVRDLLELGENVYFLSNSNLDNVVVNLNE